MDRLERVLRYCNTDRVRPPIHPPFSDERRIGNCRATKEYNKRNLEKVNARKIRFSTPVKPCEVCGTMKKIHRHHINYKDAGNIIFLCRTHHHELHSWDSN